MIKIDRKSSHVFTLLIVLISQLPFDLTHAASPHNSLDHCHQTMGRYEEYICAFYRTQQHNATEALWGALLIPEYSVLNARDEIINAGNYFTSDRYWVTLYAFYPSDITTGIPQKFSAACTDFSTRLYSIVRSPVQAYLVQYAHHHLSFYPQSPLSPGLTPERVGQYDTDLKSEYPGKQILSIEDSTSCHFVTATGTRQNVLMRCWYFAETESEQRTEASEPSSRDTNIKDQVLKQGRIHQTDTHLTQSNKFMIH
ncbi:hypothetical protein [Endozoicomonas arenosclerae]|uniref:hypothetical protein n=1 Tax=Endozoicomonas arenosclerae TaxID=1633495 RepID=UPI0007848B88|nr:hypothetical protein [Endozoicomonas arenosclerae]